MAHNTPKTVPEPFIRDAVTGERLTASRLRHSLIMRVRDRDLRPGHTRYTARGADYVELTAVPGRINLHVPDGRLGGKRYAPEFARYLAPVIPRAIEEGNRDTVEWWRVPYAVARVRRGFHLRSGPERGETAFQAALSVLRDGFSYQQVSAAYRHSLEWVVMQVHRAYSFAFARSAAS